MMTGPYNKGEGKAIEDIIPEDVRLANARLIAAAPDLLRALQAMVNHFGVLEDNELVHKTARSATKKAKAAIAKAKGK